MANTDAKSALVVAGLPENTPESVAVVCRSRLLNAATALSCETDAAEFALVVGTRAAVSRLASRAMQNRGLAESNEDSDEAGRADRYSPRAPLYTFDQLVVPAGVMLELTSAVDLLAVEETVFRRWGLRKIEPYPRTALNLYGPPGTGKTLAAHALAHRLDKKIIVASYAEIESKYHGDGPKNVKSLFAAAEAANSLLFIDEADSLLSRRLTNVTQGSEQAINSMRSQLLICLEQFSGIVIFSTNLVQNYDRAFETRVRHVRFELPDEASRNAIWRHHIVSELPVDPDLDIPILAHDVDDVCGRDIKNAVIDAAVRAAVSGRSSLNHADFFGAITRVKSARIAQPTPLKPSESQKLAKDISAAIKSGADTSPESKPDLETST
jgi:SpoVK/Ycf46/Vps4 family AAA+-type ATPase